MIDVLAVFGALVLGVSVVVGVVPFAVRCLVRFFRWFEELLIRQLCE